MPVQMYPEEPAPYPGFGFLQVPTTYSAPPDVPSPPPGQGPPAPAPAPAPAPTQGYGVSGTSTPPAGQIFPMARYNTPIGVGQAHWGQGPWGRGPTGPWEDQGDTWLRQLLERLKAQAGGLNPVAAPSSFTGAPSGATTSPTTPLSGLPFGFRRF